VVTNASAGETKTMWVKEEAVVLQVVPDKKEVGKAFARKDVASTRNR